MRCFCEWLSSAEVMEIKSNLLKDERPGQLRALRASIAGSTTSDASNGPASRSSRRLHGSLWHLLRGVQVLMGDPPAAFKALVHKQMLRGGLHPLFWGLKRPRVRAEGREAGESGGGVATEAGAEAGGGRCPGAREGGGAGAVGRREGTAPGGRCDGDRGHEAGGAQRGGGGQPAGGGEGGVLLRGAFMCL